MDLKNGQTALFNSPETHYSPQYKAHCQKRGETERKVRVQQKSGETALRGKSFWTGQHPCTHVWAAGQLVHHSSNLGSKGPVDLPLAFSQLAPQSPHCIWKQRVHRILTGMALLRQKYCEERQQEHHRPPLKPFSSHFFFKLQIVTGP